jgi:hypothetical protein
MLVAQRLALAVRLPALRSMTNTDVATQRNLDAFRGPILRSVAPERRDRCTCR